MMLSTATITITIALGTIAGPVKNDNKNNTFVWTPSASAFDRAGNAGTTTNRNETAPNDKDF